MFTRGHRQITASVSVGCIACLPVHPRDTPRSPRLHTPPTMPDAEAQRSRRSYPFTIPGKVTCMIKPHTNTTTHTIELIGSYTAHHVETGLEADQCSRRNRSTTKSAIPALCRKMIDSGIDPTNKVHVIRKAMDREGHISVFKRNRTVGAWASLDCVESGTRPPHRVKHRPYSGPVEANNSRPALLTGNRTSEGRTAINRVDGNTMMGAAHVD